MLKAIKKPGYYSLAYIFSAIVILGTALSIFLVVDQSLRSILIDVISPLVGLAASIVLFMAAKRSTARSKRLGIAWLMIALAVLFYALGDISWAFLELWLKETPFPSIADFFYLIYYPFFLVGIFLLPSRHETTEARINRLIDITIVMMAAILVFWNFLIGPIILSAAGLPTSVQAILTAYPAGDLVLLWALLLILYNHRDEKNGIPILLLATGLLVTIVSDSVYSYQALFEMYTSGGYLDIGWIASTLLIGLAGIQHLVSLKSEDAENVPQLNKPFHNKTAILNQFLPYIWLAGAYILLMNYEGLSLPMNFQSLSIAVGGIIALVLIRQVITLFDNQKLNIQLQMINRNLSDEIVERKRVETQLSYETLHDALTGLPNRALFLDRLKQSIETNKRHPEFLFAVMFVDLDQFKVVNDSLGHLVGDKLLIMVGKRFEKTLRSIDTIARFGGDEFGVLLEITDSEDSVQLISQKILDALKPAFRVETHEIRISASIGIVMNAAAYTFADEVLRDADIAMYRAKELGRNRSEVFDIIMPHQAYSRLELENELRTALEKHEFQLYYQPILFLESNRLVGFEALIRWVHPKRGLILPNIFLPIAEQSGLIQLISDWVLEEACRQLKDWQRQFPSMQDKYISLNISSYYFAHPNFAAKIIQALQSNGLKARSLRLEITEGVLIDNFPAVNTIFKQLQDFGIHMQIDNFGTGYTALTYLQRLPVDAIKIDRSFIHGLRKGGKNIKLMRAMVSMGHELGMEIIAEGIETDAQLRELKNTFCGYGQGILLSKPLDPRTAQIMLTGLEADERI
jgi:diguanylate cyclase (GGDEF)-like protein